MRSLDRLAKLLQNDAAYGSFNFCHGNESKKGSGACVTFRYKHSNGIIDFSLFSPMLFSGGGFWRDQKPLLVEFGPRGKCRCFGGIFAAPIKRFRIWEHGRAGTEQCWMAARVARSEAPVTVSGQQGPRWLH